MTTIVDFLNTILWGYVLVYGLLAVGIYFTWRTGFLQFRHFAEFFRVVKSSRDTSAAGISPFQALTISLASRVGTGNLAGVAVAIYLGGPGAVFWMWMVALVGMATAYAESTLAQLYKVRNADAQYRGGPAFYMARGIGSNAMGYVFSVCLIISSVRLRHLSHHRGSCRRHNRRRNCHHNRSKSSRVLMCQTR